MSVPELGPRVPRRGGVISRAIGRILLRLMGWRFEGSFANLPKFVSIGAPHSSNYDFIVAMAGLTALDLRMRILGKHTLFWGPMGPIMRWCDVLPVNRASPHGVVGDCVAAIQAHEQIVIGIAPEGTRMPKAGSGWKTGFWHIARQAGVPIIPVALEYTTRTIRVGAPVTPTDNMEADFALLSAFYAGVKGARRTLPEVIPFQLPKA